MDLYNYEKEFRNIYKNLISTKGSLNLNQCQFLIYNSVYIYIYIHFNNLIENY